MEENGKKVIKEEEIKYSKLISKTMIRKFSYMNFNFNFNFNFIKSKELIKLRKFLKNVKFLHRHDEKKS